MNPQRILLVDDDEDLLHIAERAVRREALPVEVEIAHSGTEALDKLGLGHGPAADPGTLSAVFLDLNLPGVDGLEVLRRMRETERLSRLPVVILSSSARARDVERSYDLGANSYVVKQYDASGPGRYIALAMRYWLELNRAPQPPAAHR